jgi:hypothetical protein
VQNTKSNRNATLTRKALVVLILSLAFSSFAVSWYLDDLYYQTRPREPLPTEGRVYAKYVHHGALVYLTRAEKLTLEFSTPIGLFLGMAAAVIWWRRDGVLTSR